MILNKKKLFLVLAGVSLFGLCGCNNDKNSNHQEKVKPTFTSKSMSKLDHDYYFINSSLRASNRTIIEKNIEDIQKLPSHYLGKVNSQNKVYSGDDFIRAYIDGNVDHNFLGVDLDYNQFPPLNTSISVKRSNSDYINQYGIYLSKNKINDNLIGEDVYLYRVPKQNLLKDEYREYVNSDSKLSYQNLICIKDNCYKEFNLFND